MPACAVAYALTRADAYAPAHEHFEHLIAQLQGTHLRRDTVIPQWFQASKATAASDGHAVHC